MDDSDYTVSSELYAESDNTTSIKPSVSENNVVSLFKFLNPKCAVVDRDGDLEVDRKNEKFSIEIEHSTSTVLNLVGLQIWRGALLLADWLIYIGESLPKDCIILELGSGVGLTSIVAAMYREVVCTDVNQANILKLIQSNVNRNSGLIRKSITVTELDFFSDNFNDEIVKALPKVKIILAADVIYDDDITNGFLKAIGKLLEMCSDSTVYVALEKRYVFTINNCDTCAPCYEYFLDGLQKLKGVKAELLDLNFPKYFDYDRVKELVLWKINN